MRHSGSIQNGAERYGSRSVDGLEGMRLAIFPCINCRIYVVTRSWSSALISEQMKLGTEARSMDLDGINAATNWPPEVQTECGRRKSSLVSSNAENGTEYTLCTLFGVAR